MFPAEIPKIDLCFGVAEPFAVSVGPFTYGFTGSMSYS